MTYPSGRQVYYTRDVLGRVTNVTTQALGDPAEVVMAGITYSPFGGPNGWTYGNGLVVSRNYDQDYRLTDLAVSGILDRSYGYDLADSIDSITDNLDQNRSQVFGYDEKQRLSSANGIYGSLNYTYDSSGNRLTVDDGSTIENYSYAPGSNQLINTGSFSFQYDGGGNQTERLDYGSNDGLVFYYDVQNRLQSVANRSSGIETTLSDYGYNALGQRVTKSSNTSSHFVFDRKGNLISEANASGNVQVEYIFLEGLLTGVVAPGLGLDVVVDNSDAGTNEFGTWNVKSDPQGNDYNGDYLLAKKNTSAIFVWSPELPAGIYEVYGWWVAKNNYNPSVTYTVSHNNNFDQTIKSHQQDGGQWNLLGTYEFAGGGGEYVEVVDQGGNTVADAVRFKQISAPTPTLHFVHTDHLGAPQAISNAGQQVVWAGDYDPFGGVTTTVSTMVNNVRFPGQYADADSSLHYNYFRDYDPNLGRYIETDPLGLAAAANRYLYVDHDPVNAIDPTGLVEWTGRFWTVGASAFISGWDHWIFNLESECDPFTGQKIIARVIASGDGLEFGNKGRPALSANNFAGVITLQDPFVSPVASSLEGDFFAGGVSAAAGIGYSLSYLKLGDADTGPQTIVGMGLSIGTVEGKSYVEKQSVESCVCP